MNLSKAVSQDMPAGRGRKGERAPRKRKRIQEQPRVVITRAENVVPNAVSPLTCHVGAQNMPLFGIAPTVANPQPAPPNPQPTPIISQPTAVPAFGSLPSAPLKPPCPRPQENQIFVYLLRFCPQQTSVCFGCGNSLKANRIISPPPLDLVLVSNMMRDWVFGGQLFSKVCNVYFHCHIQCVRRKQPYANPRAFIVTPEISLETSHVNFLREYLGGVTVYLYLDYRICCVLFSLVYNAKNALCSVFCVVKRLTSCSVKHGEENWYQRQRFFDSFQTECQFKTYNLAQH